MIHEPPAQLGRRVSAPVLIGILWAIAVLPNSRFAPSCGEGDNAELARDMLARHDWWEPAIFGLRYVEKPSLFAGLIAGTAQADGPRR